jgi:Queuosine salvage protein
MNLIEGVFDLAEKFQKNPKYVSLNYPMINMVAQNILRYGKPDFGYKQKLSNYKDILIEITANSINYCYWYGASYIRPGDCNSSFMYECVENAFFNYDVKHNFKDCIKNLIQILSFKRFPLLEERIKHLKELQRGDAELLAHSIGPDMDINDILNSLVSKFPGYASDMFLKRASLFVLQLYRRYGWYSDQLSRLYIPADYQIPKMLYYYGCTWYAPNLYQKIKDNKLISKGSLEECEIRSATILAAKELSKRTNFNVSDIDTYFFIRRKEVQDPFHLTITTDY